MIAYGLLAVVVFFFAAGPLRARMFRKLARTAPGDVYFTISNRRALTNALSRTTDFGDRALAMTGAPCIVADTSGIAFWDNTPPSPVGAIPWDEVSSVDVNDAVPRNWHWPTSTILLSMKSGQDVVVVPLLRPNGSNRFVASRRESAWLVSQLRLLRAAAV